MTQNRRFNVQKAENKSQFKASPPVVDASAPSSDLSLDAISAGGSLTAQTMMLKRLPEGRQHTMLQRMNRVQGNRHVQRVIGVAPQRPAVQPKLSVGAANDAYEQEADQVADSVMRMPATTTSYGEGETPPSISRMVLNRASDGADGGGAASAETESRISAMQGGGSPLDSTDQSFFEERMGADFSGVRVQTGSNAAQANRDLSARAFTVGNTVAFNEGEYQPGSDSGRHLLAHELTHVVQQGAAGQLQRKPLSVSRAGVRVQRAISLPDAQAAIKKASESSWGTDEEAIYQAIRDCSDRPGLKADATVQSTLKSELSGHDYWKALLLLEYGSEASYPDAVKEIWGATKGWGTDEDRIYTALQSLSVADAAIIKAVPGLQDIIDAELGGNDLQAANDLLGGKYAKSIQDHKANVLAVKNELTSMRASGNKAISNTAEWLDPSDPLASPKNKLYVLTPTHDGSARAVEHGNTGKWAYFGGDKEFDNDSSTYEAHIKSEKDIMYKTRSGGGGVLGSHLGDKIWVCDPSWQGLSSVRDTLVHEVQHDADRHDTEPGYEKDYKSPEESWVRYKTEFRAYWVEGRYSHKSAASGSATKPDFDSARQEAIFDHLWSSRSYSVWLQPNYNNNTLVYGEKFKDLIHNYIVPEGVNLVNSPRIDDFFLKLNACSKSDTDLTASPLKELETAAKALDANDRTQVNSVEAMRLQELAKDHLEPTVLAQIATIVNGGTAPGWVNVNISEARKAFEEAGSGWGTDENKIYDTIAAATAAERAAMKKDPTIRRVIFTELSGHDLWKAQFMLEYGAMTQWPQTITDLWTATKGWGTDEAAIREALQKLTRPQVEAIVKVEGLRDMLDSELSGVDKTTTDELLEGKYADAIAAHQQDMAAIDGVIKPGLTSADVAWKAICVKLNDPAQAFIHAMTATHNSPTRVTAENKPGTTAYFGADTAYPATGAKYDSLSTKNDGLRFIAPATKSETAGVNLYIYGAHAQGPAALRIVLENFGKTLP